jgi:hypothetical protein
MSFEQAQRLRSELGKSALANDLTPGISQHEFSELRDAADLMFKMTASPEGQTAARALEAADSFYRDNIAKFKDTLVNQLVRQAGERGAIEPEKVVATVLKDGLTDRAQRIKLLVSLDTWKAVAAADWRSMVDDATGLDGKVNGAKLMRAMEDRGGVMAVTYGDAEAKQMMETAKRMAAIDGKIPADMLSPGNFRSLVEQATKAKGDVDAFMKDNVISALAKPGPVADEALSYIFKKGGVARIRQARDFYGEASPEWDQVRQKSMQMILSESIKTSDDPLKQMFNGPAFYDTLNRYGRETLNEMFGKSVTDDLYKFADTVRLMTVKEKGKATGTFAAAYLVLHPLAHIGALANTFLMGKLMASPGFIHWLALGASGDKFALQALDAFVTSVLRSSGAIAGQHMGR